MGDLNRTKEVCELISFIGKGEVKIVAGLRRSGKIYLLDIFKNRLIVEEKLVILVIVIGHSRDIYQ
jgi:predicted AAA+ superfamily ATPase